MFEEIILQLCIFQVFFMNYSSAQLHPYNWPAKTTDIVDSYQLSFRLCAHVDLIYYKNSKRASNA